jgi:alkylation response protein AidB-like acyl-CoA dehydrogenase
VRFTPSERQQETARHFGQLFTEELAPALRRAAARPIGAEPDPEIAQRVWWAMADLGAVRMALPTGLGGADAGLAETTVVAELTGGALFPSPLPDTLLAADVLRRLDDTDGLALLAEGAAVAVAARDRGDRTLTTPAPLPAGADSVVRRFVPYADEVDHLLLVGSAADGVRCALVPRPDVSVTRNEDIAWGALYTVTSGRVPSVVLPPDAWAAAVTAARIRHSAYLTGLARAALDLTVAYAREHRQFGQPIGRFQALAFRLATAATEVEAVTLLVDHAAWLADSGADATMESLEAVAAAGDLARHVAAEAVQIHGAVGMTDDCDAQLFYRRAAVDSVFLGSPSRHRREAARFLPGRPAAPAVCLDRALAG